MNNRYRLGVVLFPTFSHSSFTPKDHTFINEKIHGWLQQLMMFHVAGPGAYFQKPVDDCIEDRIAPR